MIVMLTYCTYLFTTRTLCEREKTETFKYSDVSWLQTYYYEKNSGKGRGGGAGGEVFVSFGQHLLQDFVTQPGKQNSIAQLNAKSH